MTPPRRTVRATLARWLVLSEASNSINHCMGLPDLYAFVILDVTASKLGFVHGLIGKARPEQLRTAAAWGLLRCKRRSRAGAS